MSYLSSVLFRRGGGSAGGRGKQKHFHHQLSRRYHYFLKRFGSENTIINTPSNNNKLLSLNGGVISTTQEIISFFPPPASEQQHHHHQSIRKQYFSTQTTTTTTSTKKQPPPTDDCLSHGATSAKTNRPTSKSNSNNIFVLSTSTSTSTTTTGEEQQQPSSVESIESVIENLDKAASYNFGKGGKPNDKRIWKDVDSVRNVVRQYEYYLKLFHNQSKNTTTIDTHAEEDQDDEDEKSNNNNNNTQTKQQQKFYYDDEKIRKLFLSPETTTKAFRALLRCKVDTTKLSQKVREWEKYLGNLGETSMTDDLSLMILQSNGKCGNVGRALNLLSVRKSRYYEPTQLEFIYAITAIEAAQLELRKNRNTILSEKDQPQIDDPTRWLDSILLNMNQRGFTLTTSIANRMLNTYSTTGKSGKAIHYFYKIHRTPIIDRDIDDGDDNDVGIARYNGRPVKIQIKMNPPPPYHKIPSQVKGKLVPKPGTTITTTAANNNNNNSADDSSINKQLKLDRESDPNWSPALTAAMSFADSLKQGACGHDPIQLNLISYSILMKVCCNRGSLWRAMEVLDEVMPSNGIEPDVVSYNTLFTGLSRVGDVPTMREYLTKMLSMGISPSPETIRSIVDGNLNLGDVSAAITVVQDLFNQHSVLPPYTTHLKIIEFALGRGLPYEAKRHVYFIQQLWKWQKNDYHTNEFARTVELTKKNPKLSKKALKRMFAYFGETLEESDFL